MINLISKYFNFQEKDTNLKTEAVAGITTFLTMAYALFLIPSVLGDAGMPEKSVFAVSCSGVVLKPPSTHPKKEKHQAAA